jgi:hypothetical protein
VDGEQKVLQLHKKNQELEAKLATYTGLDLFLVMVWRYYFDHTLTYLKSFSRIFGSAVIFRYFLPDHVFFECPDENEKGESALSQYREQATTSGALAARLSEEVSRITSDRDDLKRQICVAR